MPKAKRSIGLQVLLLVFGLVALALTVLYFYNGWSLFFSTTNARGWLQWIWTLVSYWPRTTVWLASKPGWILQPPSPYLHLTTRTYSPYLHLLSHVGIAGVAALFAWSLRRSPWAWGISSLLFPIVTPFIFAFLKPRPAGEGTIGTCARCGQERRKGQYYTFHYGKLLSTRRMLDLPYLTTRRTYRIAGADRAWICRICVIERLVLTLGLGIALLPGLYLGVEFEAEGAMGAFLQVIGVAGLASLFLLLVWYESRGVIGERMAIKARKARAIAS
jgi:hypothetical protein